MARTIDFFFFYGSIHSYLSVMRIDALAANAGVTVKWRPFNLREILIEQYNTGFTKNEAKMNYFWHDVERRARRYGLPFKGRAPYPADPDLLALKIGAISASEGWCSRYSQVTFNDWFLEQRAPGVGDHAMRVLAVLDKPVDSLITRAEGPEGERLLRESTDRARRLGIFGAPTFAVDTEIYWGDDHLEEAIEFAVRSANS